MSFEYRFEPGSEEGPVLLLLHGTGGDEHNLIGLGKSISVTAPLISPRGQSDEEGYLRYFRRFSESVLDIDHLIEVSHQMAEWLPGALAENGVGGRQVLAVGYSNGANMAVGLVMLHPELLRGAACLRPMNPLVPDPLPDLSGNRVLICASKTDTITVPEEAEALFEVVQRAGAEASLQWVPGGHGLGQLDLDMCRHWAAKPL